MGNEGGGGGGGAYCTYVGAEGREQQHRHAGKCRVHSLNPVENSHHPKSDQGLVREAFQQWGEKGSLRSPEGNGSHPG